MRPGSPVRPMNGHRSTVPFRLEPVLPATVWVAVAIFTRAVAVNDQIASTPITGGPQGIFARRAQTLEERLAAEVVGVYVTRADADAGVARHRADHEALKAEYLVEERPLGKKPEPVPPTQTVTVACIGGCGRQVVGGQSICQPCREKQWANSGWVPDGVGEQ